MINRLRILTAVALSAVCFGTAHAGVVAHYSFDSDFTDSSGNNDLTAASGTPNITSTAGQFMFGGGALNLDNPYPTPAVGEYLATTSTIALTAVDADGWSIAFWAKDQLGYQNFGGVVLGTNLNHVWIDLNSSGVRFANTVSVAVGGSVGVEDQNWHHYALVYEDADNDTVVDDLTLYYDGAFKGTAYDYAASINISSVGKGHQPKYNFGGQLDELYIFDDAIDSTTASSLYSSNVVPEPSSLALFGLGGLLLARRRCR